MQNILTGRRILIVEDSPVVSVFAEQLLQELGCLVVGPAPNMAVARELATAAAIDAAIIDVRIRGEKAYPICDILASRNIPFALTSGYADWPTPERLQDILQISKPYKLEDVEVALLELLS